MEGVEWREVVDTRQHLGFESLFDEGLKEIPPVLVQSHRERDQLRLL